ncbi:MAG: beta-N-acetylhexosaminidase [Solirubrobacteraceae bacterium]|nr:beta-N-acetylhexosaminidase [Solirubrobacteraceae bacterium]
MTPGPQEPAEAVVGPRRRQLGLAAAVLLASILGGYLSTGKPERAFVSSGPVVAATARQGGVQPGSSLPVLPPRVQQLSARLPLARQVAQLFLVDFPGPRVPPGLRAAVRAHGWGGIIFTRSNFATDGQARGLATELRRLAPAGDRLPPLLAADQAGGPGTALPNLPPRSEARLGATRRPVLARRDARAAAIALRARGFALTLAPYADVDVAAGALTAGTFSTDPAVVTRFTTAALGGYARAGMLAAVGHFPGEGSASQDPDLGVGSVGQSLADLRRRDEAPFAAVAARAPAILMSNALYAAFDGVTPAGLLPTAVAELRGHLRFHGVIVSDDLGAAVLATRGSMGEAAVLALRAGVDLIHVSGGPAGQQQAYRAVLRAARRGEIPAARLQGALGRVLALKLAGRAVRVPPPRPPRAGGPSRRRRRTRGHCRAGARSCSP